MRFDFTDEQRRWREEVRSFIKENLTPELQKEVSEAGGILDIHGPATTQFIRQMGVRGWLGVSWPPEYGGLGKSVIEQYIFFEELEYWGAPSPGLTLSSIAPTIMRVGSDELKQELLPPTARGEVHFNLGYSEPNAGTDLANIQCRAVLDGDDLVITGQKMFNSFAHFCTHHWLVCRTSNSMPKHRGISIIVVPKDTPGITIRPLWTFGDMRTNEVFFDAVRVPKKYLVGELNRGWYYAATALDYERIAMGPVSPLDRMLNGLVAYCKDTEHNGRTLSQDPVIRLRLAEMTVEVEVARLLGWRTAWMMGQGLVPNYEASQVKVVSSELRARLADVGMQIMGLYGQLDKRSRWVPLRGLIEQEYRLAPFYRFAGGTNEIQRNIIAQRGLGLPRG